MKRMMLTAAVVFACSSLAGGSSFGFNLKDADFAVAGVLRAEPPVDDHLDLYRLDDPIAVAGELPRGAFRIVAPRHICYHTTLADGVRMLLFLREVEGGLRGNAATPLFMALAADMAAVPLEGDEGGLIVEAVRLQAEAVGAGPERGAAVMAQILSAALEPDRPTLLQSALIDAIRTPGAIQRLDQLDRAMMLEHFRRTPPHAALKCCLLDALGEAQPEGMAAELVATVRGPGGGFHRDQIAAILSAVGGSAIPADLIRGFDALDGGARGNVLYVLGRLGFGQGVSAIRSAARAGLPGVQAAAVEALFADRSPAAVAALGELAAAARRRADALAAVHRLACINSDEARGLLARIRDDVEIDPAVRQNAAESLIRLAK